MFFGGTKIVYSSEICYNVELHEAEIDKIEYEEVKKDEKMSHDMIANILLRENNICIYENKIKYILFECRASRFHINNNGRRCNANSWWK